MKENDWPVTQIASPHGLSVQSEVIRLKEELEMRDQLVQQLSQELFRLVKGNQDFLPTPEVSEQQQQEMRSLREQMHKLEEQVIFYQTQIEERDAQTQHLHQTNQELTDRTRMLEQVVQELPRIYKEKFAERMGAVKDRVAKIQQENRELQAELQSTSYRLAMRSRRGPSNLDLPTFPSEMLGKNSMPSFAKATATD
ncbi:MAG: Npun_F5560 family protein [Cyanobacteria bacterium P01_D01_bin.1]